MSTKQQEVLEVPAIEIEQGPGRYIYSFGIDGKALEAAVSISRIKRDEGCEIDGYQRPEVVNHIREIRRYIESESPMIPNALVVAFDKRVKFKGEGRRRKGMPRVGSLRIPLGELKEAAPKPGWVVDGQQRLAAIREARVERFQVFVTAFIAEDAEEQRAQFILVNNTRPLPKGLIHELLPATASSLPTVLERRRFPAQVLERLNFDEGSPFKGRIKSPTNPDGIIKDNSVLRMIENSLQDGVLYRFWDASSGEGDVESCIQVLSAYWSAVARVFSVAWELPPRKSRLVHGVGIVALGFLMDAIADRYRELGVPDTLQFEEDLEPLELVCSWTSGFWDFGPGATQRWDELQNTSKDTRLLASHLLSEYKARVWDMKRRCEPEILSGE